MTPEEATLAAAGGWLVVRLGLVNPMSPALVRWREAHAALVGHIHPLHGCDECGRELCELGQALWEAVEAAEALLPWRVAA